MPSPSGSQATNLWQIALAGALHIYEVCASLVWNKSCVYAKHQAEHFDEAQSCTIQPFMMAHST